MGDGGGGTERLFFLSKLLAVFSSCLHWSFLPAIVGVGLVGNMARWLVDRLSG